MRKTITWFAVIGGVVPLVLLAVKFIELYYNSDSVPYASLYGFYMWPTSILLVGSQSSWDIVSLLFLIVSIIANIGLYVLIGLLVVQIQRTLRGN